jgi:hypothetical protein
MWFSIEIKKAQQRLDMHSIAAVADWSLGFRKVVPGYVAET